MSSAGGAVLGRISQGRCLMLELYALKDARTVLRGLESREALRLPDRGTCVIEKGAIFFDFSTPEPARRGCGTFSWGDRGRGQIGADRRRRFGATNTRRINDFRQGDPQR